MTDYQRIPLRDLGASRPVRRLGRRQQYGLYRVLMSGAGIETKPMRQNRRRAWGVFWTWALAFAAIAWWAGR